MKVTIVIAWTGDVVCYILPGGAVGAFLASSVLCVARVHVLFIIAGCKQLAVRFRSTADGFCLCFVCLPFFFFFESVQDGI